MFSPTRARTCVCACVSECVYVCAGYLSCAVAHANVWVRVGVCSWVTDRVGGETECVMRKKKRK